MLRERIFPEGRTKKLSALSITAIAGIGIFSGGVYLQAPQVPAYYGCQITDKLFLAKQKRMTRNYRLEYGSLCGLLMNGLRGSPNITSYKHQYRIIDTRETAQEVINGWVQFDSGWEESLEGLNIAAWQPFDPSN